MLFNGCITLCIKKGEKMSNLNELHLNENQKGYVYITLGIIVLLYAFGFFQTWLNTLVIVGGILLAVYGFIKIGGVEKIRSLISKGSK